MIVGYFQHESIFDVPYKKNNSLQDIKDTSTPLYHGIGVQLLFDDKFGSVLICTGKPKVSVGGGEWAWLSPVLLLYFYCNLICELLHVLIINPKGLLHHDIPQYLSWLC